MPTARATRGGREPGQPLFASAHDSLGHRLLALDYGVDLLLQCSGAKEVVDEDPAALADAKARSVACSSTAGFHESSSGKD
jgi:hypothetical protein